MICQEYESRTYFSTSRSFFSVIGGIPRFGGRSLGDFLPSKRLSVWWFERMDIMRCWTVLCSLVVIHRHGDFNTPLTSDCAVDRYVIWSLNHFTAWSVTISVTFDGGCCRFWTNFRLVKWVTSQIRQNGVSTWSKNIMRAKNQFTLQSRIRLVFD